MGSCSSRPRNSGAASRCWFQAEPLIRDLGTDQSLRELVSGLEDGLIQCEHITLDDFTRAFNMASDTPENVIAGQPARPHSDPRLEGQPGDGDEGKPGFRRRHIPNLTD